MERPLRSAADVLLLDLGDADAPGDRAARRRAVLDTLSRVLSDPPAPERPTTVVRLAPLASGLVDADLDAVMAGAPDAVLLPGTVGGIGLQHLAAKLAVREAEGGLAAGRTGIVAAAADTASGVLVLGTLVGATPRLRALAWDSAPLARALATGPHAEPVRTARGLLLVAAGACGVPALNLRTAPDPVCVARLLDPGIEAAALRAEAVQEGHAFVARWLDEWASGANRFDGPDELFLGAWAGSQLVGVGGLNRDPYAEATEHVGRVRHLYVLRAARGRGIATLILSRLVAAARPAFARLRLRAGTEAAGAFYAARGFALAEEAEATHALALDGRARAR